MIGLRALEPDDALFMFEAESDPSAWRYSDYLAPLSLEMLRQYALTYDADPFRSGALRLVVECDGAPAGIADLFDVSPRHLRAECGIYVLPAFRGRGVATEAVRLLAAFCRDRLGLHLLAASVAVGNVAAERCFLKAGFRASGCRPGWLRSPEGYEDVGLFSFVLSD